MKKKLEKLFENLCCSQCKNGFDENSFTVKRDEEDLTVVGLKCSHCGKDFGMAFLGFGNIEVKDVEPLEVQQGPEPIDYNDVIDAHRFIKNLKGDWSKYLPS